MSNGYRSSSIAIDARRASDAGPQGSMDKYLAKREANREQAERECAAFWQAADLLREGGAVGENVLDLAVLYIARHGENAPPTLRWDQCPAYRVARARIRAAHRARANVLTVDEIG